MYTFQVGSHSWQPFRKYVQFSCDPTFTDCPPDEALGLSTLDLDFTQKFIADKPLAIWYGPVDWTSLGLVMTLTNETDKPFVLFPQYLFFGRVDVTFQAAPGSGVSTVIALYSDDHDEIDWIFGGNNPNQATSAYLRKGLEISPMVDMNFHTVPNAMSSFHTHSIDWNSSTISWLVDNTTTQVLTYSEAEDGAYFPQTPMQPRIYSYVPCQSNMSIWDPQCGLGYVNATQGPFTAYITRVTMHDYMNGNISAKEYIYTDKSGSYQAISIVPNPTTIISSTSTSPSTTATQSSTSTQSAKPTHTSTQSKGLNTGAIAGIVIGGFVVLLVIGLVFFFVRHRKQKRQAKK